MKIRKAVIPAEVWEPGFYRRRRRFPRKCCTLVDKPTIQYIIEEAVQSGIEQILIITGRGKSSLENHFDRASRARKCILRPELDELLAEMQAITIWRKSSMCVSMKLEV